MPSQREFVAKVYLSRRNLLTLLAKLDDPGSLKTLHKHDVDHKVYPQSHPTIIVTAVEDADYYVDRNPGRVNPLHDPDLHAHYDEDEDFLKVGGTI